MKTRKFILFCLFGISQVFPQDETDFLEVTFSVFPLDGEDWENIHYSPIGDPASVLEELRFDRLERSKEYLFSGPAPLLFYRIIENPDGTRRLKIIGSAPIPPGRPEHPHILFCLPPEEETGRLRILGMVDNEETFPNESVVVYNTLNIHLQGALGEEMLEIPPGLSRPVKVGQYVGNEVLIAFAINHNNQLRLVLNNKISFHPDRRDLLILRKPRRPTSLRIRTQRLTEYMGPRVGDFDAPKENIDEAGSGRE